MAKINNSKVIQKLIDELQLYPGKDLIPTELAEKILPVFQVNTQEIITKNPICDVVKEYGTGGGTGGHVVYTAPATGKFYLTAYTLNTNTPDDGDYLTVVVGGVTTKIAVALNGLTGIPLNFPLLLDAGSIINLQNGTAATISCMIMGYTEE